MRCPRVLGGRVACGPWVAIGPLFGLVVGLVGLVVGLSVGAGCGPRVPPVRRPDLRARYGVHVVKRGETLSSIAERYGVTVESLVRLNDIDDPNVIGLGQELLLPIAPGGVVKQSGVVEAKRAPRAPAPSAPSRPVPAPPARPVSLECALAPPAPADRERSRDGFSWPVDGVLVYRFGQRAGEPYEGVDIAAPVGTPVWASRRGRVVFVGKQAPLGRIVVVDHGDGWVSLYGRQAATCVQSNVDVERGQVVGLVGPRDPEASPYLFFQVRKGERPLDPEDILPE